MSALISAVISFLIDNLVKPALVKVFGANAPTFASIDSTWIVGSVVVAILVPPVFRLVGRKVYSYSHFFRALSRVEEKYCGNWLETIQKNGRRYLSIIHIRYNRKNNNYVVSGTAFDETGEVHATFDSYTFHLDDANRHIELLYSGIYAKTGRPVKGWCIFSFETGISRGHGHLVDFELDESEVMRQTLRISFDLLRLKGAVLKRIIGKRSLKGDEDNTLLVSRLLQEKDRLRSGVSSDATR